MYTRGVGLVAKSCLTLVSPWVIAHPAPLSMGFLRQEYWSGLPFPSPGESSRASDRTRETCIAGGFFTTLPPWEARVHSALKMTFRFLRTLGLKVTDEVTSSKTSWLGPGSRSPGRNVMFQRSAG